MLKRNFRLVLILAMALASVLASPASVRAEEADVYRISAEDVLEVLVADHAELSVPANVLSDGTVSLPLLGSVKVGGLTVDEVKTQLELLYNKNYITKPTISVNLRKSRIKQFYIYGEVKMPGTYTMVDDMTVLKAVISAGGFTDYSNKSRVKVMRKNTLKQEVIIVNVKNIEKGILAEDIAIEPGDIIEVPEALI